MKTREDLRGYVMQRVYGRASRLWARVTTAMSHAKTLYWGVDLGRGCVFYGLPMFRRFEHGKISIGDRCDFRSAQWSNPIGANRRCSFAAYREGAVIEIGHHCRFSATCIVAAERISIGNHVVIAANTTITDSHWKAAEFSGLTGASDSSPVEIGDDTYIGVNCTILQGVKIGQGCVVGAGSVVTRSVSDGARVAGCPAREMIRSRLDDH